MREFTIFAGDIVRKDLFGPLGKLDLVGGGDPSSAKWFSLAALRRTLSFGFGLLGVWLVESLRRILGFNDRLELTIRFC